MVPPSMSSHPTLFPGRADATTAPAAVKAITARALITGLVREAWSATATHSEAPAPANEAMTATATAGAVTGTRRLRITSSSSA
jgi:hypothetical protein